MSRLTIDYGIDLGTTNSALALLTGVNTEIIKNSRDNRETTPSAVSLDKHGNIRVGQGALNKILEAPEDAYAEFKRLIGTDSVYRFKASGQTRTPEQLSAEVLKSLRNDAQVRKGELIDAAVITVPAAFELHQCDATKAAARLAGLRESPLLQEPVAAALAHGFQSARESAYWLVYDFGGGTFDAALVRSEDGMISVVNHSGDPHLGGSDIDRALVERTIVPRLLAEFPLKDFSPGNLAWKRAFLILKYKAETYKIELSQQPAITFEVRFPNPATGEQVEFECPLTQADVLNAAEPYILRSVEISKKVLREKNVRPDAVERVILVGGPTLAPYFREVLSAELGLKLDFSVDPLTVVARGAAIFGGTRKANDRTSIALPGDTFALDLKHRPVGADSTPLVGGRVSGGETKDFTGYQIEITNTRTQWRSGRVAVKADGVFMVALHADPGDRNEFVLMLYDPTGRRRLTHPATFSYTIGSVVDEQPLINSMGLALANNQYLRFFGKGAGLPMKKTMVVKTLQPLRRGESGGLLKVPVVEGENELADRNRLIDSLEIRCSEIRRDLPMGSDLEVTLVMDESRILHVQAYVPILDQDYEAKIDLRHRVPSGEALEKDFAAELARLAEARGQSLAAGAESVHDLLDAVEESPVAQEIRQALRAASVDPDAAARCERRLLEFKLELDDAANRLEWPALVVEARDWDESLRSMVEKFGTDLQRSSAAEISADIQRMIDARKSDRLRTRVEQAKKLYFEICMGQPSWWVYQFQILEKRTGSMTDTRRAAMLIDHGHECIAKNNTTGLQNVVRQLWELTPDVTMESEHRGYESGVIR